MEMLTELKDYGQDVLSVALDLEARADDPVYMTGFVPWFKRHAEKLLAMGDKQERCIRDGFLKAGARAQKRGPYHESGKGTEAA
jgi:hypothetical protein